MATVVYSILHFLVDGICAWAMFGWFLSRAGGFEGMLIYNFCAFALQLPFGIVADRLAGRKIPALFAFAGAALTVVGALTHPAVLGIGNALFHVGGGVGTIREDWHRNWNGQALGVFVAPGALGLFLGGQAAKMGFVDLRFLIPAAVCMALLFLPVKHWEHTAPKAVSANGFWMAALCLAVVVLRSHVGMAVVFPWKSGFAMGLLAVLAVVLGKIAGGLFAARFGMVPVTAVSLSLAALGFLWGAFPAMGLLALFCFNMTMPLTLYALVRRFPQNPGAVFGLLTFGLFLGFLPTYYGWGLPISGTVASVVSLGILIAVGKAVTDGADIRDIPGADNGH